MQTAVKKDNSNIYAFGGSNNGLVWRTLRKERYRKTDLDKSHQYHRFMHPTNSFNPYDDMDLQLDISKFKESLDHDMRLVFVLFMQGYSTRQIATHAHLPLKTVYRKLQTLLTGFRDFYQEEDSHGKN